MWAIVRELLALFGEKLLVDAERMVKTKSLLASLQFVKGARLFSLSLTLYIMLAVLTVISLFSGIMIALYQYSETKTLVWTSPLIFSLSIAAMGIGLLVYFGRESYWIKATKLDQKVLELAGLPTNTPLPEIKTSPEINKKALELEALIDQRIDQAVNRALSKQSEMTH